MTETTWTWQKGHFYSFRATRDIAMPHGAPFPTLREDEVFEFDGTTMKMDDGEVVKVPQLQGCLVKQWIVSADDTETQYVPQAAGVEVHAAKQMGNDPSRGAAQMVTSHDDMQQVGSVEAQRKARSASGESAVAKVTKVPQKAMSKLARQLVRDLDLIAAQYGVKKAAPKPAPKPAPALKAVPVKEEPKTLRERMVVSTREEQVVGPARPGRPPLDEGPIRGTEVVTDSGRHFAGADEPAGKLDVGGAKPLMVTATRTEPGQAKADKTASMVVEVEDQEGVPIASLGKPQKRQDVTDTATVSSEVARLDKPMGKKTKFQVVEENAEDAGEIVSTVDEAKEKAAEAAKTKLMGSTPSAEVQQTIAGIKMFVPDFAWNLDRPWKERVADAVDNYAEKPDWLRGILGIETPDVQRHIKAKLKKAGVEI